MHTHFGTITNKVVKYSESKIKCSFFTKSARFRVNRLPLENQNQSPDLIIITSSADSQFFKIIKIQTFVIIYYIFVINTGILCMLS